MPSLRTTFFTLALATLSRAAVLSRATVPAGKPIQIQSNKLDVAFSPLCLTAAGSADGSPVIFAPCSNQPANRTWVIPNGSSATTSIVFNGNKCLDVTNGADASGTKLQIWSCVNGNTNQMWKVNENDGTIRWVKDSAKCLDLTDGGNIKSGSNVQIWSCTNNNVNQKWTVNPVQSTTPPPPARSQIEILSDDPCEDSMCVTAPVDSLGAPVTIQDCNTNPSTRGWTLPAVGTTGQITVYGDKCVDVTDGKNAPGTRLQIWDCVKGNKNQLWKVNANSTIQWAGTDKCVDLTDGKFAEGTQLQIWTCSNGNPNQEWLEFDLDESQ